jgi:hypothetical protein
MPTAAKIYTIGYECLKPARLSRIAEGLNAIVIDCRSRPVSRRPGFGGNQLRELLGDRYVWRGDCLGGMPPTSTTRKGIAWLSALQGNCLLMCLEEAPGDCHRHSLICGPHFPDAVHIFRNELVTARELARAIRDDDEPELHGSLRELI